MGTAVVISGEEISKDVLGRKSVPGTPYLKDGVAPHIWVDNGKAEWYACQPTQADRNIIRKAMGQ